MFHSTWWQFLLLKFGETRADTAPLTFTFFCAKFRVSKYYQLIKQKYCFLRTCSTTAGLVSAKYS